jgi:uncharacterized repeat protein (TIGR03803 family)
MKRIVNAFLGKLDGGKRAYAVLALCAATAIALPAQTLTTLLTFYPKDGTGPNALVQATSGNLLGTAGGGGLHGQGTVFEITPAGTFATLHNFNEADGLFSAAALIQDTAGDFYGTTVVWRGQQQWDGFQNQLGWHSDATTPTLCNCGRGSPSQNPYEGFNPVARSPPALRRSSVIPPQWRNVRGPLVQCGRRASGDSSAALRPSSPAPNFIEPGNNVWAVGYSTASQTPPPGHYDVPTKTATRPRRRSRLRAHHGAECRCRRGTGKAEEQGLTIYSSAILAFSSSRNSRSGV